MLKVLFQASTMYTEIIRGICPMTIASSFKILSSEPLPMAKWKHVIIKELAAKYGVVLNSVIRIWKHGESSVACFAP